MSLSFSRSMKSLEANSLKIPLGIIILGVVILCLWALWFFFAKITLFETTQIVEFNNKNELSAKFPSASLAQIKVGQIGWLHVDSFDQSGKLVVPLLVIKKDSSLKNEDFGWVHLIILDQTVTPYLQYSETIIELNVETDRISPARLVLKSAGQFNPASKLNTSPYSEQK